MSSHLGVSARAIVACWIIFFLYWVISARRVKATVERQSVGGELTHRAFLWAAALLLFLGPARLGPLSKRLVAAGNGLAAVGLVIVIAGLALAIWARQTLGGNWSSAVTYKAGHELIETGPYRWVRNPIYTGMLLMFLGTAVEQARWASLLALVLASLGFWIKLGQEERVLARHFPEQFPAYRRRVKALIPFLL